jgi:predicted GIY-YIG superfamily endonuclease
MPFFCYIVECEDGSFYTGWSTDPVRRERQHALSIWYMWSLRPTCTPPCDASVS